MHGTCIKIFKIRYIYTCLLYVFAFILRFLTMTRHYLFLKATKHAVEGENPLIQQLHGATPSVVKWPGPEFDPSPPFSANVKDE